MAERPFRILGVQQVAIGASDRTRLHDLWVGLLGAQPKGTFRSEKENVDEEITTFGRGLGEIEFDLMAPVDPEGSPRVHQPALNHIGLWVDDLEAAFSWLGERGVRFTPGGIRKGAAGHSVCFIHPKGGGRLPSAEKGC